MSNNIPTFDRNKSNISKSQNRGYDTNSEKYGFEPVKVGLQNIDNAILKYLQQKIKPVVDQSNKQIIVPVLYGNPERWKSVQRDGLIRDQNGKIQLPVMMIRRTSMEKSAINSPVNKYNQYVYKTGWNSKNIYDRFAALNRVVPNEAYSSVIIPDFYKLKYEALIWTEYMEQMNSIIESVSFEDNEYWGEDNNYKFISRISNYEQTTELPKDNDRMVRNKFNIDVNAYIIPESTLNKEGKRVVTTRVQYGPKKVVFDTEIVQNLNK